MKGIAVVDIKEETVGNIAEIVMRVLVIVAN
jgi:hypothetical protein